MAGQLWALIAIYVTGGQVEAHRTLLPTSEACEAARQEIAAAHGGRISCNPCTITTDENGRKVCRSWSGAILWHDGDG